MTPEEREARAEQLVEKMAQERRGHDWWPENRGCRCGWLAAVLDDAAPSSFDQWERHVESAVLNVVRTERSQITCPSCVGTRFVRYPAVRVGGQGVQTDPCPTCIDGSVPGELLVVGLIGEQVGWMYRYISPVVGQWTFIDVKPDPRADTEVALLVRIEVPQ